MMKFVDGVVCCGLFLLTQGFVVGAEFSTLVATVKSAGPEGAGNEQIAVAWKELAAVDVKLLPELLATLDDANPLAANWLRSAVETVAQRELDKGGKLPARELEQWALDTKHDPRARRLAFELLTRVDSTAPDRLIPSMLEDPSVELRRDAVARVITQANSLFDAKQLPAAKQSYLIALRAARDDDQIESLVKRLVELGEKVDLPRHFGFLMDWSLIGPFDNTSKKGFDTAYPPETNSKLDETFEGKEGKKISWTRHTTTDAHGIVNLNKAIDALHGTVAYLATDFQSDQAREVEFRMGTPNAWKIWLNDKLIFGRDEYHRGTKLDQYKMRGMLQRGTNRILVKCCQNEQTDSWAQNWQIQLRVCDRAGTAILSTDRPLPVVADASESESKSPPAGSK